MATAILRRYAVIGIIALVGGMVGASTLAFAHDVRPSSAAAIVNTAVRVQKIVIRRSAATSVPVGFSVNTEVGCPKGYFAIGGGAVGSVQGVAIVSSFPSDGTGRGRAGFRAWTAQVNNTSSTTRTYRVYVGCVPAASRGSNYLKGVLPGS